MFAHICSFVCVLQTAAETQMDGSPTECCSGQRCNFVFFQEDAKTKPVVLKCPSVTFKTDVLHSEAAAVCFAAASPNILET